MDITFRGPGPWGPGKGANLQATEVDNNFWELAEHILSLENDPPVPTGIDSITVSGTQMWITLTTGEVMGPFTLPVLTMRWRDEWQPNTLYAILDVFKVTDRGIWLVELAHTSGDEFDPNIAVDGEPALMMLFGSTDAHLSQLPDVSISGTGEQDGDALIWNGVAQMWVNRLLGSMAYQDSNLVDISGGWITGLAAPTHPDDAATKAYVDAVILAPSPIGPAMMISNVTAGFATPIPNTLSDFLDASLATSARGTLLFRGATGWAALAPGTNGLFLKTSGAGADPVWSVGGSGVTSVAAGAGITTGAGPITATGSVALAAVADNSLLANASGGSAAPSATTLTTFLDHALTNVRGSVLVRAGSGWVALAPGTAGYFLQTQGSTADPQWASPAGAGTVTSVSAGTGISTGGAPITGAGTVSLAAIANLSVLANISGSSAAPIPATATALFDALFGATQGAVLYRSASAWAMLSPGTAGQVLTTGGGSANPAWANAAAGAPIANLLLLANISGSTAAASGNTLSNILDAVISSSRGTLLYRGAAGWTALAPGTTGQLLQTGGAAGDPSWVAAPTGGGGASITTSDTPPASPADGDAWWDSVGGQLYIRYDDGNSAQWVPAMNSPGPTGATGATGPAGATGPTGPAGSANMSLMTAGQIPIAASATSVTSSANLSGDVTSAPTTLVTTLATVNANVGTFQGLTLDGKGRVTAASNQNYVTGGPYLPTAGGTLTGALAMGSNALTCGDITSTNNIKAGGGIYVGNPYILFNGNLALTHGPYISFDNTNLTFRLGTGNGNFNVQNEAGTVALAVSYTGNLSAIGTLTGAWVVPTTHNTGYCGAPTQAYTQANAFNYGTPSDISLKTAIESLPPDCLGYVLSIEPHQFRYIPPEKADPDLAHVTDRTHWGFIAQEVEAAMAGTEFGGVITDPESGLLSLSHNDLIATLWAAVRELKAELDALKAGAAP